MLQQHADAMGPLQHEPDREEAQRARDNVQREGVKVDERGKIELSDEANYTMKKSQWITKHNGEANNLAEQVHGPPQRTLSKIMRNLAQIEAAERYMKSNEEEKHEDWKRVVQEPMNLERATRWNPHAQRTLESSNTSEDRVYQRRAEHEMKNQDERRLTLRDNDRPKRDTQPAM